MDVTEILYIVAAVVVGVLSTARLTRLITEDTWPPVVWLRMKWDAITDHGPWYDLVDCPWCAAPWLVAPNLVLAVVTDLHPAWWIINGWLAASLVTSWVAIKVGE
jgi:hypothetical protein